MDCFALNANRDSTLIGAASAGRNTCRDRCSRSGCSTCLGFGATNGLAGYGKVGAVRRDGCTSSSGFGACGFD